MHTWTSSFWLTSRELRSAFLLCEELSLGGESAAERGPGAAGAAPSGDGTAQGAAAGAGGHRGTGRLHPTGQTLVSAPI